ncbi:MarR family transcriptional regulator [Lentzea sp. NBRC 105346]|uniref:MarR family winged helix-turn-helix transcriptional regulator n=1 Tax=Lentzea sp. NBRC 105346 TaxID=3032205 RepID=UPI0024A2A2F2|nr:MarR family winged helix-turn-helix transcriptional regulator [Lentzea sp. NBRC 105346]GLZ34511.1 MarR family transcriptional regulator [Lentzea sp. NBRC 105346]
MTRFEGPEESPGFLLWRVTLAWQRAMRAALAPHDLTHVQFVLLASLWWLENHGGSPSQQRLAAQAGTDSMMTSQVLRKLEDRGLLTRSVDPADSRARLLSLTAAGERLVGAAMKDVEDADAAYFAKLGEPQQFLRGLAELTRE